MADEVAADCAARGDTHALTTLLEDGHILARGSQAAKDGDGTPLLHLAAVGGHLPCVRLLLAHGADPNAQDRQRRVTPLVLASVKGHSECAQALRQVRRRDG